MADSASASMEDKSPTSRKCGPVERISCIVFSRGRRTRQCNDCMHIHKKIEPGILTQQLRACIVQGIETVAFQALDDPRVRDAIYELAPYDNPTLTLLSGLENAPLVGFVGVDNRAAGRTAAFLMGQMTRSSGKSR